MPALTIERYGGRLIYFWFGMRFGALMKLFKRGNYSFTLNCIPDTLLLFLWVPWNSVLYWISEAKYQKRAETLKLDPPPIFVIGHWRTGTTLLHDLFSVDPNLAYPTTFECFFPHHFLLTEGMLPKVMKRLLPKKRPQDDVPVGFDRPQEEEFGMMMLGEGTPYLTHAWPRLRSRRQRISRLQGRAEPEKKKWADAYMWFYRRLLLKHGGKRLVMKTPANAARLKLLTKLFPDARYVYLARNPLNVFPSTVKLWRALYSVQGLHNPPRLDPWLDDYVLDMFARLTEDYEEDRHLIPKDRLVELRYEDFVKDPVGLDARHLSPASTFRASTRPRRRCANFSPSAPSTKSRATTCRLRSSARSSSGSSPISTASAIATRSTRRSPASQRPRRRRGNANRLKQAAYIPARANARRRSRQGEPGRSTRSGAYSSLAQERAPISASDAWSLRLTGRCRPREGRGR